MFISIDLGKWMNNLKLVARGLSKSFSTGGKTLHVLESVNIEFEEGKSYAITGASGSGKSTFLHLLAGLDTPSKGEVFFGGNNIFNFKQKEKDLFLNKSLGFVFQFHYLIRELSVLQNIIIPGLIKGDSEKTCKKRALELLDSIGLIDKAEEYPSNLSGGEQQRVAILRAIFNKPKFLLADEPTGNLDSKMAQTIINMLLLFKKEWGMGLILCSHDSQVYSKMDVVLNLHAGKISPL